MADPTVEDTQPFPGYDEALSGLRDRLVGGGSAPVASATPATDMLPMIQQLFMQTQAQEQKPEKPIPNWLYLIPGGAKGIAMRKEMDAKDEELKLRKAQLAGQQATQRLQQIQMMHKIQQQQNLKRWAGLYGGLVKHEDVLDPDATREIEGKIVQEIAEAGDPEAVQKFIESRTATRAQKAMDAAQARMDAALQGGTAPNAAPTAEAAPAPTPATPAAPVPLPTQPSPGSMNVGKTFPIAPKQAVFARMIIDEAKRQGVDPNLALAVAQQESGLNPNVPGDGGKAIGLFQLHAPAAQDVGLTPDERHDVQKNIRGGIAYLKIKLQQENGDVDRALRRYNGGGDPNYVQNVRRFLPKSDMSNMVAGPGAPAQAQPQGMSPGEQMQRDRLELARLRQQEAIISKTIDDNRRFANTKDGKARLDMWKDQREEVQQKIKTLDDRLSNIDPETGIPRYLTTPESVAERTRQKQAFELEKSRVQGAVAAEKQIEAAKGTAPVKAASEAAQKRLEAFDKGAMAAEESHTALDEVERLLQEGVYGTGAQDLLIMKGYDSKLLYQNDPKAIRTARLREIGAQLVLARGTLGGNVSNADAQIYAKAAGNFEQGKSPEAIRESIKSMRTILDKAIEKANKARETYETTGKMPAFEGRGGQATQAAPSTAQPTGQSQTAPSQTQPQPTPPVKPRGSLMTDAEIEAVRKEYEKNGQQYTLETMKQAFKAAGYKVQ